MGTEEVGMGFLSISTVEVLALELQNSQTIRCFDVEGRFPCDTRRQLWPLSLWAAS